MTKQSKSGEGDWYRQEANVTSDPLVDSGTGIPVIMRFFEFEGNSELLKKMKPSKQEIFDSHAQQIRVTLWADGLQPFPTIEPRLIPSKKKDSYRIMVGCIPKAGVALADSTKTLQELIKTNG